MTTLTAQKKARKAEKAEAAKPKPAPKPSVLKKYEPTPPLRFAPISWNPERGGFNLEVSPTHHLYFPATARGAELLEMCLRARYMAEKTSEAPRLGSETYPTQAQIDTFLKLKSKAEMSAAPPSPARVKVAAELFADLIDDMGL